MVVNDFVDQHVEDRHDLSIEHIAHVLDIKIGINENMNCYIKYEGVDIILLVRNDPFFMWQAFCHELGHMVLHATKQSCTHRMFNDYQEGQADKFAILLMMPEKLIRKHRLYDAQKIACYFNVTTEMALKRVDMLIDYTRSPNF